MNSTKAGQAFGSRADRRHVAEVRWTQRLRQQWKGFAWTFEMLVARASSRRAVLAEISSADLPGSESVRWDDRLIGSGSGRLEVRVRVYRPAAAAGRGAVLFLHGGGFILGDLEHDHAACLRLTRDIHCSVVSVDYRLAPEDPFPAAIEDCYTALMWLSDHCDELGIDPERLAVGGSSAGGGLAASLALMAGDRSGPPIAFQFLLYPMLDDRMDTASMAAFADVDGWNGAVTRQCLEPLPG